MQLSHNEKRNPCSHKGNWKFFNPFSPKTLSYSKWLQRNTWFYEKEFIKYASARATFALVIMA